MKKFSLVIILISALVVSCTSKSDKEVLILDLKDLVVDTLYLEKDTLTKNLGSNFSYSKTDSGEVLATFINHQLLVYSYPEGKLLRKQKYEKEGPNGIGSFITGNFIDDKSIYFLSQQKELIQCNYNGKVLARWDLPEVDRERMYANYSGQLYNKLYKSGNELYFVDIPFVFQEGFEDYDKWGMVFNTESHSFSNYRFLYPENILDYTQDDQLGLFSHVYNSNTREHLIGFSISDSIAVVKNGKQTWKWAGSSESLHFKKGTLVPSGEYTVFQPNPESSKFNGLDFDSHAKKILRWVRIKGPTQDNPDQQKNRLLVFDMEFNSASELNFNTDEFGLYGFNTPQGYALSLHSETSDDLTTFAILDFSKINSVE